MLHSYNPFKKSEPNYRVFDKTSQLGSKAKSVTVKTFGTLTGKFKHHASEKYNTVLAVSNSKEQYNLVLSCTSIRKQVTT